MASDNHLVARVKPFIAGLGDTAGSVNSWHMRKGFYDPRMAL
jgi:hypothetical protein